MQDQDDKDNNNKYEEKDNIISRYLLFLCVQIAALSPADINYEETLSTLRFGELLKRDYLVIPSTDPAPQCV